MAGATAAVVGSAAVSGIAANKAAKTQAGAAKGAARAQQAAADQMRADLAPYSNLGLQAIDPLWAAMGYKTAADPAKVAQAQAELDHYKANIKPGWDPGQVALKIQELEQNLADAQNVRVLDPNATLNQKFSFDATDLESSPGYQFALQQGLKTTNNALAAQGLGLSGAQAKGLSQYATGLADQTYGDQFNRALSQYGTNYQVAQGNVGNLMGLVNVGQNSAAQQGQAGLTGAANAGNFQTQAANASASGLMGMANATQGGLNNYLMYNALYGNKA